MNKRLTLFTAMVLCLFLNIANAQVSITNSTPYTQDFNTLPTTGTSTTNPNPANWLRYAANGTTMGVTAGSATSGGFYSAGTGTNTDRAMGILLSQNAEPLYVGLKFVNNTGSTIVSASVSYKCEQWRRGNTNAGLKDTLLVDYATGTDSVHQGSWTNAPALTGSSTNTGTTAQALDGNANFATVSGSITGMAIPNGATFWVRFRDFNVFPGSDDLLAVDDFSISFTTGVVPTCTEPASSVTNVVATATSTTAISGSFTGTTADGYLVLIDSNATVPTIADASTYAVNDVVGTATVIGNGTSTSFSRSGLVPNTIYKVHVFPYNSLSCLNGPNYKTSAPGNDTAKTLVDACPEPTTKPTNLQFTLVNNNNINGKFNKAVPAPNGGYVVVYSTSSSMGYPNDTTSYAIGDSIKNGSAKSKVAYVGTDSNFVIPGLVSGTRYYVAVIPFNSCPYGPNYFRTSPLRADTITSGTAPLVDCVQPTGVSSATIIKLDSTTSTISIKWKNSVNADSVLVFAGAFNTIGSVTLHDSVFYPVNSFIPSDGTTQPKVYYRGTDTTVNITGLLTNTLYKIFVVAFNNKNCTNGPNYGGLANTLVRTAAGTDCVNPTGVSSATIIKLDSTATSISIKWRNSANADSVLVFAGNFNTIGNVTLHDSVYYPVNSFIPSSGTSQPKVYYRGTDSTVNMTGLTPNTLYKIFVVSFNNKNCTFGPNYGGLANTIIRTALGVGVKYNNAEAEFALYPNPTNSGLLFVKFKTALREKATIEIIDILGRKLNAQNVANGSELQTIDVSNLAKGTYLLNVNYKGSNNVSTFIVD